MKKHKLFGKKLKQKTAIQRLLKQFYLCTTGKCGHGHKPGSQIFIEEDCTVIEYTDPLVPTITHYDPKNNKIYGVAAEQIIIDDPLGEHWTADARL